MPFQRVSILLGGNIKRFRLGKGLSQIDLAALTNIEQAKIARLESGQANPTLRTLVRICEALEVSMEDLVKSDD